MGCGPGSGDWIHQGDCKACNSEDETDEKKLVAAAVTLAEAQGSCPWYNNVQCINSEGQCQPCNKCPWYATDGERCVCGPGSGDWIHQNQCKACNSEDETDVKKLAAAVVTPAAQGSCPWYNNVQCINSEGQCQPCNKSPWYATDGERCVCGPGSGDWIHQNQCKACNSEDETDVKKLVAAAVTLAAQGSCPWYSNVQCINSEG